MTADKGDRNVETKSSSARAAGSHKNEASLSHEPMELTLGNGPAASQRSKLIAVGVFAEGALSPSAKAIDEASKGRLSALIERGDLESKAGSSLMLFDLPGVAAPRVLLVSLGPQKHFDDKSYYKALEGIAKTLAAAKAQDAMVTLAEVDVPGRSVAWRLQQASRVLADGAYRFDAPKAKTNGGEAAQRGARNITLLISGEATPELQAAVRRGHAIAEGMALAKDLGNLPGNVCNPAFLADTARSLGKEFNFNVDVLERADMAKLGMGSALSVGQASDQPCKFIVMHYKGGEASDKPIVLVGKGVTFDTGGVSLKPGDDLDMMKYDMCGAASVLGTMKAVARLKLPINVISIIGAVENMPGGNASRPGDVVTSMSGITIEILNTDAEGRLVLCDALTYAERFKPECVIDVATLTGACVIALGSQTSGLYANDDKLAEELFECGTDTGDRAWRMPLWDEYQEQLKTNFADMSNLGGRPAGSITAAIFLSKFAKAYHWAHLDIAGTASVGGPAKGATGRPVPLLSEFLVRRSERAA
jgi:leucyl aminopeptidase